MSQNKGVDANTNCLINIECHDSYLERGGRGVYCIVFFFLKNRSDTDCTYCILSNSVCLGLYSGALIICLWIGLMIPPISMVNFWYQQHWLQNIEYPWIFTSIHWGFVLPHGFTTLTLCECGTSRSVTKETIETISWFILQVTSTEKHVSISWIGLPHHKWHALYPKWTCDTKLFQWSLVYENISSTPLFLDLCQLLWRWQFSGICTIKLTHNSEPRSSPSES